jgi:hypothetical protein
VYIFSVSIKTAKLEKYQPESERGVDYTKYRYPRLHEDANPHARHSLLSILISISWMHIVHPSQNSGDIINLKILSHLAAK